MGGCASCRGCYHDGINGCGKSANLGTCYNGSYHTSKIKERKAQEELSAAVKKAYLEGYNAAKNESNKK